MADLFGNPDPVVYKNRTTDPIKTAEGMGYNISEIRRKFYKGQWYFAYMDVISVLTDRTNMAVYGRKAKLSLHEHSCALGIEARHAYGRKQVDGIYDVVDGVVIRAKQELASTFGIEEGEA